MPPRKRIFCNMGTVPYEYVEFFEFIGWNVITEDMSDCDFVLFSGGHDVGPPLYNTPVHPFTRFSRNRDKSDTKMLTNGVLEGKHLIGICRGAQFLHVKNGGRLWQHIDNDLHLSPHELEYGDTVYKVTSTHHQVMRDTDIEGCQVLAQARLDGCTGRSMETPEVEEIVHDIPQLEIVTHTQPDDGAVHLCFQPHPEYVLYDRSAEPTAELFVRVLDDVYFSDN